MLDQLLMTRQINRINDERIAVGKSPVGFINPVLYEHPEVLNDSESHAETEIDL